MNYTPVVTFSHLRWNSVFQRPQHIMTRLAERRDVVFVEEPITSCAVAGLEVMRVAPRIRVLQSFVPVDGPGFGARQQQILQSHLQRFLEREGWDHFAAWIYTPMAVSLARALNPSAIVYDRMGEPSHSRPAPPELAERERELLECADAVFTGGPGQAPWHETVNRMEAILRRLAGDHSHHKTGALGPASVVPAA